MSIRPLGARRNAFSRRWPITLLSASSPIPDGTHIVPVHISGSDAARFRNRLARRNIHLPQARWQGGFWLKINPSLNRMSAQDVAQAFLAAL